MPAEVLAAVFSQTLPSQFAMVEWVATIAGLAMLFIDLITYWRTKDASMFKGQSAWTIYILAAISAILPVDVSTYAQALGAFGALFATLITAAIKLVGVVVFQPFLLAGMLVMGIDRVMNIERYRREGKLFKEYVPFD